MIEGLGSSEGRGWASGRWAPAAGDGDGTHHQMLLLKLGNLELALLLVFLDGLLHTLHEVV